MRIPPTLVVTNDFPPKIGGAEQYVANLVGALPPGDVTVLAPGHPGWREHDRALPYRVVRTPQRWLVPTRELADRAAALAGETGARVILFGHGFPLAALGPALRRSAGLPYVVLTHGWELWFARTPGARRALRRALSEASSVFAISDYMAARLQRLVPPGVPLLLAPPAVDPARFRPGLDGGRMRRRFEVEGRRVVGCVSRLVRRKGQDVLIRALPLVLGEVADAALLVVGDGPDAGRLRALAASSPARDRIVLAGAISDDELPHAYAAMDVFAMPCRSRWGGLEVEGFGIVFLEAAAAGVASVAGDSGGAAEAVASGETGLVVDGRRVEQVAAAVAALLAEPARAKVMGAAGRERVEERFTWPHTAARVARALAEAGG